MILDSGTRKEFDTGAVRDIQEGKGRCDLLPLRQISVLLDSAELYDIDMYVTSGNDKYLYDAVYDFAKKEYVDINTAVIEVSKHYEEGAIKYGEHNWRKGIPVHCYIDSGVRHLIKHLRGDKDERHDRAFVWNMLGAIWTHANKPDLIDFPIKGV